jgi:hypothetical protein
MACAACPRASAASSRRAAHVRAKQRDGNPRPGHPRRMPRAPRPRGASTACLRDHAPRRAPCAGRPKCATSGALAAAAECQLTVTPEAGHNGGTRARAPAGTERLGRLVDDKLDLRRARARVSACVRRATRLAVTHLGWQKWRAAGQRGVRLLASRHAGRAHFSSLLQRDPPVWRVRGGCTRASPARAPTPWFATAAAGREPCVCGSELGPHGRNPPGGALLRRPPPRTPDERWLARCCCG